MNLQKAKILLQKINALYENMSADERNISRIEKDLMRSYIQQLYDSFLDLSAAPEAGKKTTVEVIKSSGKKTASVPVADLPKSAPKSSPPPVEKAPDPEPEPDKAEERSVSEPKRRNPGPVSEPTPAPVTSRSSPPAGKVDPELEELFSFTSAKELSEKLSELPILDIRKAMGLNERIFTMNELFGGDQAVFDLTLDTLNKLPDFTQAKAFLLRNAASKYNWAAKERKNKAKNFIKLVKRRYN